MKILAFATVFAALSVTSTAVVAQVPLTTATCTNANLNGGVIGKRVVGIQTVYVRRLATVLDQAMDDYGNSAPGDALELFCLSSSESDALGVLAACLSKESCPWR